MELLAPAGSREALTAAVESGADAVYLAGSMFGARAYASNFDEEQMKEAIRFAHLRKVAVHVTVNTIADDGELGRLAEYLTFLYEAGADAILVQDLGVAKLAQEIVPGMPLHASTQMTVHNLEGVLALERLGFSRVVLSRELSLQEIRYICSHAHVEIESFVHGALCVCYSGQCLMSSLIGGRSGNRGRCAQPCRLPYTLVDDKGRDVLGDAAGQYLLSPKDLNTMDILPELVEAGISSLKIEGRMKRPEYVATVVGAYRKAVDRCLSGEGYLVDPQDRQDLAQIFNRDFTTAYLEKPQGRRMMSDRRPNNRGLLVGRVTRYDKARHIVSLRLSADLALGDQVDFWVKVGGRVTAEVQELWDEKGNALTEAHSGQEVCFSLPSFVREHDRVFKVYDAALMARAKSFYASGSPVRRIPLSINVKAAVGSPLTVEMRDGDGYEASAATEFLGEEARKRPLSEEVVRQQMGRLGTSIFSLAEFQTEIQGNVMVPVSEINEARRRAVESLEQQRLAAFRRPPLPKVKMAEGEKPANVVLPGHAEIAVSVDSREKAAAALRAGADVIIFGGESYSHVNLSLADYQAVWQMARDAGKKVFFHTPRIVLQSHQKSLEQLLQGFGGFPSAGIYVHNIGILSLAKRLTQLPVHADYSLISYNHLTLEFLAEQGVMGATLSPELSWQQIERLAKRSPIPLECIVHGRLELMVSRYCVTGSFLGGLGDGPCKAPCRRGRYFLQDRKDVQFPLVMDQFCQMHVLNGKTLSMLPYAHQFAEAGIGRIRIEGKAAAEKEIEALVHAYRKFSYGEQAEQQEHAAEIQRLEGADFTRGHYFRGVL